MIVTKLEGGIGNQMFQYAIASIIAKKNNATILIDNTFTYQVEKREGYTPRKFELFIFKNSYTEASKSDLNSFNQLSKINRVKRKLGLNYPKIYKETSFGFDENLWTIPLPVYLKGYFQSYKYLKGFESFIVNVFTFPVDELDLVNKKLLLDIKTNNSISIHIRRGDYVNDKKTQNYHGNCSLEYYRNAISLIASKVKDIKLFFFSDDSEWVKEQFQNIAYPKIFVENNSNENSWKDMLLMSFCNHNVIANSSFSWWAAWLNKNVDKIVIAPKKWFVDSNKNTNDLIPTTWTRL